MAMEITSNYNAYESTYATQKKNIDGQKEMVENAKVKESTTKKCSKEEYLKSLQKQVPYMKLQIGSAVNTKNDGKVDVLDINPKLLEKMQNDPEAAMKYSQRLKDVEAAHKFVDNYFKATGSTVVCSHAYLDENGNYCNFTVSVHKDTLNEKLRKEAQENAEKQIEKIRENNRKKAEQLEEKNAAESEEETEEKVQEESAYNKAEQLLEEKIDKSKDGKIYLNDTDIWTIIEAAQEENADKTTAEDQPQAGANLDLKI